MRKGVKAFKETFRIINDKHLKLRESLNGYDGGQGMSDLLLDDQRADFHIWWDELAGSLYAMTREMDLQEKEACYTCVSRSKMKEIFQEAPFHRRIILKPAGYAGDAEMMNMIYRNAYEGLTSYGRFLHKISVESKGSVAVRNRKKYLKRKIIEAEQGRILSVAAGPAIEMIEVLDQAEASSAYTFHALDHDINTIQAVCGGMDEERFCYYLASAIQMIQGDLTVINPVSNESSMLQSESYDLVYSAGLFDYIRSGKSSQTGAEALAANLFRLVKPGGRLIIGNFSPNNPEYLRFAMEYIQDWFLIYRTKDQMMSLAAGIPAGAIKSIDVEEEEEGINYFLAVTKTV